jgi:hypothetical protein
LILRRARREDAEAMAAFNAKVHHSSDGAFEQREPHRGVAAFTRDLISGDHPACDASDFTVIEDTTTGSIVSSACLIGQRFSYEEVELDAGLPELVGTHPDYRRRGLVREQFEVLHRWSKERGHLMQAIASIPYYYRRFGYETAVWMGKGRRVYVQDVPGKPSGGGEGEGSPRTYGLRPQRRLTPGSSRMCTAGQGDATCSPRRVISGSGATRWPGATPRATSHWR